MTEIKLTSDQLGLISLFQSMSGAGVKDCIVDEKAGRLLVLDSMTHHLGWVDSDDVAPAGPPDSA